MNIVSLVNIERILDEVRNNIRGFYISVDGDIKEREFDKEVDGVMYFDVDKIKSEANYDYFEIAYTSDSSVIFICDEEGALKCRFDENGKEMMNNNIIASVIYQKLCNNHKAHLFGDVVICHTSRVY